MQRALAMDPHRYSIYTVSSGKLSLPGVDALRYGIWIIGQHVCIHHLLYSTRIWYNWYSISTLKVYVHVCGSAYACGNYISSHCRTLTTLHLSCIITAIPLNNSSLVCSSHFKRGISYRGRICSSLNVGHVGTWYSSSLSHYGIHRL